jgi:hypothetical protein
MSYLAQDQLYFEPAFQSRVRAVCVQQAETFKDDARPDWVAVADQCLRGDGETYLAFTRMAAGGPGIADKVDNGDGTIDQSNVTDEDLLALTQANWATVAGLYFDANGIPLDGPL